MSRILVALGGNALIRRGEEGSTQVQRRNLLVAARSLADLEAAGHRIVLTHGNGPQVGFLAIEADAARDVVPPPPLDVLVAESQGQIGYLLAQALSVVHGEGNEAHPVAVLATRTVVDPADPAFGQPSKPIGPMYDEATAHALAVAHGWSIAQDGAGWRRVVASPRPIGIVEADAVRTLVDAGVLVIASGGGGIPVGHDGHGTLVGIEAVIDKDRAAVVLAEVVDADGLLLLTDVGAVHRDWGTTGATPLPVLGLEAADIGVRDGTFAPGSMGPKVEAAATFVRETGRWAAIGALEDALAIVEGRAGTWLGDRSGGATRVPMAGPRAREALLRA